MKNLVELLPTVQKRVFKKLLKLSENQDKYTGGKVYIGFYCKNSWEKRGFFDSSVFKKYKTIKVLEALEKKGFITLHSEYDRQTGLFNSIADSWGYSGISYHYYVTVMLQ